MTYVALMFHDNVPRGPGSVRPLVFVLLNNGFRRFVLLLDKDSQKKSSLCYAYPQVSGTGALLGARTQLGGIRWGRVHRPSRIFFKAI
jgi:hypothetical protein